MGGWSEWEIDEQFQQWMEEDGIYTPVGFNYRSHEKSKGDKCTFEQMESINEERKTHAVDEGEKQKMESGKIPGCYGLNSNEKICKSCEQPLMIYKKPFNFRKEEFRDGIMVKATIQCIRCGRLSCVLKKFVNDPLPTDESPTVDPETHGKEKQPIRGVRNAVANEFTTNIAGVSHEGRQELVRKLRCGEQLMLKRDPGNTCDSNAIKILNGLGDQLGFIPAGLALTMAPKIDGGVEYTACVEHLVGGTQGYLYGCVIRLRERNST